MFRQSKNCPMYNERVRINVPYYKRSSETAKMLGDREKEIFDKGNLMIKISMLVKYCFKS